MTSAVRFWGVVALLVATHFLLAVGLGIQRGAPDLLLLSLLLAVREMRVGWAASLGLFLGALEDAFAVLSFGANALAFVVVAIVGSRTRDLFVGESGVFIVGYLALGKVARDLIHWLAAGEGARDPFVESVLLQGGVAALYLAGVGSLVALLAGALNGRSA